MTFKTLVLVEHTLQANIYLFKVSNRNTRKSCEIYTTLTIKTPERGQLYRSGVFIVNFEHISHLFLLFLLLTLHEYLLPGLGQSNRLKFS